MKKKDENRGSKEVDDKKSKKKKGKEVKKKMFLSSNSSDDFVPGSLRKYGTVVTRVPKEDPKKVKPSKSCDLFNSGSSNVKVDGMPSDVAFDSASTSALSK